MKHRLPPFEMSVFENISMVTGTVLNEAQCNPALYEFFVCTLPDISDLAYDSLLSLLIPV